MENIFHAMTFLLNVELDGERAARMVQFNRSLIRLGFQQNYIRRNNFNEIFNEKNKIKWNGQTDGRAKIDSKHVSESISIKSD